MAQNRFSAYTGILVGINAGIFLLYLILTTFIDEGTLISTLALQPATIATGSHLWTLITSMFLHAGISHLFFNLFSLIFIGSFVERLIGKKRFLIAYLASGIFAGIFFVTISLITGDVNVYAVGASGAIFGLGGLLAVLTPRLPVLVFFIIPMPMWLAMIALMIGLWIISIGLGLPIGNTAHLGGLLIGLGYGFYLKAKYPERTKMIRSYFAR
jgi:membrane associated rhomboid family serine protease